MTEWFAAFSTPGIRDLIEVAVITILFYQFLLLIKGTRGWQMTLGITALVFFYYLTRLLELRTVEWLLANFFTYFVFALIVIFQSELRRGLAELGRGRFFRRFSMPAGRKVYEEVVLAATTLSSQKIGGLIVVEREIGLKNYIESGIKLDAYLTYDILVTIFNPASPLHDGAVIIQDERAAAAGCFLPLTLDPYLSKELGTRHRAAIGITEETDAVAVVISEETGNISAVYRGEISRNLDGPRLLKLLQKIDREPDDNPLDRAQEPKVKSGEQQRQKAV
jgi:diadenylate cyclase